MIGTNIFNLIEQIASIGSTNEKERILTENKDMPFLKEVLYAALSPRIKYYIKQMPDMSNLITTADLKIPYEFEYHMSQLKKLSNREVTGHASGVLLIDLFLHCDFDPELIKRIVLKDLRMGIGKTIVNKVFKDLIEVTPYQGAKPFSRKLVDKLLITEESVFAQLKMDGCYSNCVIRDNEPEFESRQGEKQNFGETILKNELSKLGDCVLNGELTMDGVSDRATANGLINSIDDIETKRESRTEKETQKKIDAFEKKSGMTLDEAKNKIRYTVWDQLTIEEYFNKESKVPYVERLAQLKYDIESNYVGLVEIIESKEFNNFKDIMDYYISVVEQGMEGIIVKSKTAPWKNGKPNWAIKIKEEIHLDLKITGYRFGTGKNSAVISSIEVESEDGLLKTVPTGLKEAEMKDFTENKDSYLGKIIEVKCSGLSTDKDGNYSVLHPVFIEKRFDKDKANTLAECFEIVESSRNL